jgi:hypothetical protein
LYRKAYSQPHTEKKSTPPEMAAAVVVVVAQKGEKRGNEKCAIIQEERK